jgi:hypothetical protein
MEKDRKKRGERGKLQKEMKEKRRKKEGKVGRIRWENMYTLIISTLKCVLGIMYSIWIVLVGSLSRFNVVKLCLHVFEKLLHSIILRWIFLLHHTKDIAKYGMCYNLEVQLFFKHKYW